MESFQTEFNFILPMGYVDKEGTLHKEGTMRLATAGDEIIPLKDPRVQQNPGYLSVILLSRVVTKLGGLDIINTKVIEDLFAADFAYLQQMYNRFNQTGHSQINATCPKCNHTFEVEDEFSGE
ncbi:hypothetical protein [Desulfobacter vibrioformis]|uniref:hypothetical protein n=1 Tax=Desulfobacter vibrioformis TaxID=34031 RepID=UPI00054FE32E|nr:hypothetical protein [Desulfobacter vibrioformis]